jgi:nitrite reductase/ring-hydroxylating ferredoxin subunit
MSLACLVGTEELVQLVDPSWWFVGRSDEILEAGQYFSRVIGTEPVAVVRSATGEARAHLNSCRHRGMQILTGTGKVKALRCPYHGWMYSLDGELRAAPEMSDTADFDKADFPLKQLTVLERSGSLYVNIDGQADSAEVAPPEVQQLFDDYGVSDFVTTRQWEITSGSSWRSLVETIVAGSADLSAGSGPTIWRQAGPRPGTPPFGQMLPPNMTGETRKGRTWVWSGPGSFTILDEDMTLFLSVLPVGTARSALVARLSLAPRLAARARGGDAELVPRLERVATKTEDYLRGVIEAAATSVIDDRKTDSCHDGVVAGA